VDKITLGPELLKEMEHAMVKIRQNLKVAQNRQKSYVDSKRTHREFNNVTPCFPHEDCNYVEVT
jgi:hypothetical protein